MRKFFHVIVGILLIILGFYVIFNPLAKLVFIAIFIGISLLVDGMTDFIGYFRNKNEDKNGWELASGVINVLFGSLILFSRLFLVLVSILPVIIAFWLVFIGISRIIASAYHKKTKTPLGFCMVTTGILSLFAGVLMILNPVFPIMLLSIIIGAGLIVSGVSTIFSINIYEKKEHRYF